MNENEITVTRENDPCEDQREIANMDQFDFMTLLIESRIIQMS